MRIGAILPHMLLFGGVRRYIELARAFLRRGHRFVIYTPDGSSPDWCEFDGACEPLSHLGDREHDVLITGSPEYLDVLRSDGAPLKVFYIQIDWVDREREIVRCADLRVMANSIGIMRRLRNRYGIVPLDGRGGVDPDLFHPAVGDHGPWREDPREGPLRILCYGRLARPRKGTRYVVSAVESMHRDGRLVELHLFDTRIPGSGDPRIGFHPRVPCRFYLDLSQQQLAMVYRGADVFVSAERRAGWSNTCAEAAASGLPLVCTASGTGDFAENGESALVVPVRGARAVRCAIERLYGDGALARRLGREARRRILGFTWDRVCDTMLEEFR
ncbi:MAG: glycosyltransferase family 4 protein, partial [Candidatus Krumholzibacteria bacterium]|nr:glycosyltransferase family 4 protein [Candidatus Krumholzibacteria bacterium]